MTKPTRQEKNEAFRKARIVREWEHDQCFKPADPDCEWCHGWGETQDENPANCECVQRTPAERAEWLKENPRPE